MVAIDFLVFVLSFLTFLEVFLTNIGIKLNLKWKKKLDYCEDNSILFKIIWTLINIEKKKQSTHYVFTRFFVSNFGNLL